jgi:hypothetical protein
MQVLCIVIEPAEEDGGIADEMHSHKGNHHKPCDRHHNLSADTAVKESHS